MFQIGTIAATLAVSVLLTASGTAAQNARVAGVTTTFAEGTVSFVAPPGFTPLTSAELTKHFPRYGGVAHAVGDPTRRSTIAYELDQDSRPTNDLEAGRTFFTDSANQDFHNPKWIANEIRRIGMRDWVVLEFVESVSPTPMRQIVMFSVHRERVLLFNFRAPVTDFPGVEQQLRAAMASVVVRP